jgi:hypothetical protein
MTQRGDEMSRLISARQELIELSVEIEEAVDLALYGGQPTCEIDLPTVERLLRAFRTALGMT